MGTSWARLGTALLGALGTLGLGAGRAEAQEYRWVDALQRPNEYVVRNATPEFWLARSDNGVQWQGTASLWTSMDSGAAAAVELYTNWWAITPPAGSPAIDIKAEIRLDTWSAGISADTDPGFAKWRSSFVAATGGKGVLPRYLASGLNRNNWGRAYLRSFNRVVEAVASGFPVVVLLDAASSGAYKYRYELVTRVSGTDDASLKLHFASGGSVGKDVFMSLWTMNGFFSSMVGASDAAYAKIEEQTGIRRYWAVGFIHDNVKSPKCFQAGESVSTCLWDQEMMQAAGQTCPQLLAADGGKIAKYWVAYDFRCHYLGVVPKPTVPVLTLVSKRTAGNSTTIKVKVTGLTAGGTFKLIEAAGQGGREAVQTADAKGEFAGTFTTTSLPYRFRVWNNGVYSTWLTVS